MTERSQPVHLRIFVSSPGDVADERGIALQLFDRLQYDPLLRGQVTIEAVAWDKPGGDTPMLATMTPQEAINQGLPKPSECDIVVVIFWSRMGTPLPAEYTKPDGTRYLSGTEWEYEDAMRASLENGFPKVVVYRRTEDISLNPRDPGFTKKLEQWQRVEAFFATFVNPDGSIRQGSNHYASPADFGTKFETHLKVLIKQILDAQETLVQPIEVAEVKSPPLWEGSPFPGLRAFTPQDAPIYFGRALEADALVKRVGESRLVVVAGASGSGKSSLVGAGLIPRLNANAIEGSKDWFVIRFTPGELGSGDPFEALVVALLRSTAITAPAREWTTRLHDGADAINLLVKEAIAGKPNWAQLVFFIDQFEELFTLAKPQYIAPFVDLLGTIADSPQSRAVLTLRADFYARCVEVPKLAALLENATYPLAAPELGALYEMIALPASRSGLEFETGLVDRILRDTGTDPGALALMAYTLDELYKASADDKRLTHAEYDALHGVQGAIGERAEITFIELDADAQSSLPDVFREICEVDERGVAIRRRSPVKQAARTDAAKRLVDALTGARLLVQSQGEGGEPIVEVAHEALLRNWSRLAKWIEATQDDLRLLRQIRLGAEEWARNGRKAEDTFGGSRLERASEWLHEERLDAVQREFIQAGVTLRDQRLQIEREQQARETQLRQTSINRQRMLIGVLIILVLVFAGFSLYVLDSQRRFEATITQNYYDRGLVYAQTARYGEAVAEFSRAIESRPDYTDAYFQRAEASYFNGQLLEAVTDYDQVLAKTPDYPLALDYRSRAVQLRTLLAAGAITSAFEGGGYAAYQNRDSGIISYGRFQSTLASGTLATIVQYYVDRSTNPAARELYTYLPRLNARDETLRDDQELQSLLITAGEDPIMQEAQDVFGMTAFWQRFYDVSAQPRGIQTPLGLALLFDMAINHGIQHDMIGLAETSLGVPPKSRVGENGITEEQLIREVARVRQERMNSLSVRLNTPGLKIRGDFWVNLIEQGDWQLLGDTNGAIEVRAGRIVQVRQPEVALGFIQAFTNDYEKSNTPSSEPSVPEETPPVEATTTP